MNHQNQQIKQLEQLLQQGKDSAFLRFGLANAYWQSDNFANALQHVAQAVRQDPYYSAAWKLYGKVLTQLQRYQQAIEVFQQGIEAAQAQGDQQAVKEMQVFLKKALKKQSDES